MTKAVINFSLNIFYCRLLFFQTIQYVYITYKQVQIRKRVWPQVLRIQTRPFPKRNLKTMKTFYIFYIKTNTTSDISRKKEDFCALAMKLIWQVFLRGINMFKDGEYLKTSLLLRHMEESKGRQHYCKMTCRLRALCKISLVYVTGKTSKFKIVFSCWSFIVRLVEWFFPHFQQYFSHIKATTHIIHDFPGFHEH